MDAKTVRNPESEFRTACIYPLITFVTSAKRGPCWSGLQSRCSPTWS